MANYNFLGELEPGDRDKRLREKVDDLSREFDEEATENGIPESDELARLALFRGWAMIRIANLSMDLHDLIVTCADSQEANSARMDGLEASIGEAQE